VNVTATLFGQIGTFIVLIIFLRYVLWEPMLRMMQDRQKRIADGLAAAEHGRHEQELAEKRAKELIHAAKQQATEVIAQAQKRATEIVEEAKDDAREEGARLLTAARAEIEQEMNQAKESLRERVATLAIASAEKILQREINAKAHSEMLGRFIAKL
jgi:F-type H+-transporting ATPase subunit b